MVGSVNKVILVGNVGKDPEVRLTQTGDELAIFSIATSERWKDKNNDEMREKTEWHRVVVFSPGLVKVIKNYVSKGSKVYIEGSLQTREYQDQSGITKYTTEVVLKNFNSNLTLLDSKKTAESLGGDWQQGGKQQSNQAQQQSANQEKSSSDYDITEIEDEIPF